MALRRWWMSWLLPSAGGLLAMAGICLLMAGAPVFAVPRPEAPAMEARTHRAVGRTIAGAEETPRRRSFMPPPPAASRPAVQSPGSARGEGARDVRWDLMEMAGARRGSWATTCPCPVYVPTRPTSGPR